MYILRLNKIWLTMEKKKVLSNEKIVKDFTEMIQYFSRGQITFSYSEEYGLILQGV